MGKELWFLIEYMDRSTLRNVTDETHVSGDGTTAVGRDIRDPICISESLGRIV